MVTNPYLTSDPSEIAYGSMFDTSNALTGTVLAAALSGYGIDFMSGNSLKSLRARDTADRMLAENLQISFSKPQFIADQNKVIISNIYITTLNQYGSVYFLLVLYKQFVTNPVTN